VVLGVIVSVVNKVVTLGGVVAVLLGGALLVVLMEDDVVVMNTAVVGLLSLAGVVERRTEGELVTFGVVLWTETIKEEMRKTYRFMPTSE